MSAAGCVGVPSFAWRPEAIDARAAILVRQHDEPDRRGSVRGYAHRPSPAGAQLDKSAASSARRWRYRPRFPSSASREQYHGARADRALGAACSAALSASQSQIHKIKIATATF